MSHFNSILENIIQKLGLSISPQLAITTLKAMESTFANSFIVLLPNKKVFNTQVFQIWTYLKVGCKILTFYPLVVDFNQHFNNYNIRRRNHKDGSIVSYQLLFTKPRASNVFAKHCYRVANTIHLNQLHVLCKDFKVKWQCMCIITTQPICNYQDKSLNRSPYILVTINSMVPNSSKFALCIKSKIECVGKKHK